MSKAYLLMHASFLVKWRNRMLIRLMVSVRQFRLIKRRLPRIRARQLERSLKLMITCDCCGRGSGIRFVLTMGRRLPVKVLNKWWTASWLCRKRAAFRFCHRLCGGKKAAIRKSLPKLCVKGMSGCALTVKSWMPQRIMN